MKFSYISRPVLYTTAAAILAASAAIACGGNAAPIPTIESTTRPVPATSAPPTRKAPIATTQPLPPTLEATIAEATESVPTPKPEPTERPVPETATSQPATATSGPDPTATEGSYEQPTVEATKKPYEQPTVEAYSGFYDFPERFFEESSVPKEQLVKMVDAQYLSLKKMHNGISPYEFLRVEYDPEVYGSTLPDGIKLGDAAFPGLNSGHHRWEVMAHEEGHNFFGGTSTFYYNMAAPHAFLQESLAVLSAFYTFHDILENQEAYGIDDNTIESLVFDFTNGRAYQEEKYNEYIGECKNFNIDDVLTSQALDFKMIQYGEKYGWDKFERVAKAFEEGMGIQFDFHRDGATPVEQSTYIIAALSAAFDQDFRQEFSDLNFPIDDVFFDESLPKIKQYIGSV